jgi:polyhydroxybutyrate depolymerase
MRRLLLLLALLAAAPAPARACGPDTDCVVGERSYRIRLPPMPPGGARVGAILFAHGHRDTAANIMAQDELGAAVAGLGLALVAPQSAGPGWALPGGPGGAAPAVDEVAAIERILADVLARFPVDPQRVMASGFSAGGMLAWTLACRRADLFAGFAPIAGTHWDPVPATCPTGPATVLHMHGRADAVVPLGGRPVREARQGDVSLAVARYASFGGFGPAEPVLEPGLDCTRRRNAAGRLLELCLHDGGHELRAGDVARAWRLLAAARGW